MSKTFTCEWVWFFSGEKGDVTDYYDFEEGSSEETEDLIHFHCHKCDNTWTDSKSIKNYVG
jgi:hypothetical protein